MAQRVLEVFKNRTIELYEHPELIHDLKKLNIISRSFGYKLEAASDATGHADLAFAFAIALPAAVELSSIAAIDVFAKDVHPLMSMDDMQRRIAELKSQEEQERIAEAAKSAMVDLSGAGTDGGSLLGDLLLPKIPDEQNINRILEECGIEW